jgi:hypothetical protein
MRTRPHDLSSIGHAMHDQKQISNQQEPVEMKFASKIITLTAISTALALNAGAVQAADTSSVLTMKPLHGISFDAGAERAVSYFTSKAEQCQLVLTMAEAPRSDDSFTSTRFETSVPAGKVTHFNSAQGNSIEFSCAADAQAMTARITHQLAAVEIE